MIDLKDFAPQEHPSRPVFKRYEIPLKTVANYLGLSYQHTCGILSGHNGVPPKIEAKLKALVDQLESGTPPALDDFEREPHPYKAILRKHGLTIGAVARHLGMAYVTVCNILNGQFNMTEEVDAKLQALIERLEAQTHTVAVAPV